MSGIRLSIVCAFCLALFSGCRSVPPVAPDGSKPVFKVYVDPNESSVSDPVWRQRRREVASWMADDCVDILSRGGCEASRAASDAPPASPDIYFLKITITDYRWRYMGTTLDVKYSLSKGGKRVLSSSDGCGTSRNWRHCCRKVNMDIVDAIRSEFAKGNR